MSRNALWAIRVALAAIYVWFGVLKLLDLSPATQLVHDLFDLTVPLLSFGTFMYLFASFEVLLGIAILVPRLTKVACAALALHVIATMMPLVLLPQHVWMGLLIPTLEGQFILKNLLILACAYALSARSGPER